MVAALLAGCASLNPSKDIQRAADVVRERSGVAPAWDQPWGDRSSTWDGQSPLTVEQATSAALRNNRQIRAEVEQIAASRADLVQAGLLPNPVLSLTLRFPPEGYTFVGISAIQEFTALWLRPSRIRSADARLNETVLSVSDRALRLVADVKAVHARLVYGQRAAALTRENIGMVERSIEALGARVRGGEGTPLDVNRARQQLLALRAELTRQELELAKGRREVLQLIGAADASDSWIAADGPASAEHEPLLPPGLDEAEVVRLAVEQRLDVAASREVVESRRAELSEQELSRLKELGVGVDYERDTEPGARSVGPVFEAQVPIFDFNQAQIAKAGSLARASLAAHEAVRQGAVAQARTAYVEAGTAADLAELYESQVLPLAQRNLELAQGSLKAGQDDVTVLLEAQRDVVTARRELNSLRGQAALARIELEYAVGGRLAVPAPAQEARP